MSHTYAGNSVAIVSSTDANPIAIVATSHGRTTGDRVLIAGHLVNTRANGEWVVTVTGANGFTLDSSGAATGAGAGGATGTVTRFAPTATLPDDVTDQRSAASVNSPFGTALDRLQMLYQDFKQRMLGIFPIVPGKSVTRVMIGVPLIQATQKWVDAGYVIQQSLAASPTAAFASRINIPHGAKVTGFRARLMGASGHGALPATMPTLDLVKVNAVTGVPTSVSSAADASANVAAYEALHYLGSTGLTEIVDNTLNTYFFSFIGEGGANYLLGLDLISFEITFTVPALDIGAS